MERKIAWRLFGAFVFLVLMSTFAVVMVQVDANGDRRRDREAAAAEIRQTKQLSLGQCIQNNDVRNQVRDLIQLTIGGGGGSPGFDITAFPSFPALPPEMKAWVRDLQKQISGGGDPERTRARVQEALAKVPLRDCETEFPGLTPLFPATTVP